MPTIFIAEHHDQVLAFWKERHMTDLDVVHFDFHCDMRGIMIDRKAGNAFFVSHQDTTFVDKGNYLAHAVMDGRVTKLTWVLNENAGRRCDTGPVVSYESDALAPLLHRKHQQIGGRKVPLTYRQCLDADWGGMEPGQQLDLDWDALASVTYDEETQKRYIDAFLAKDFQHIPDITFLVYSPGYSNPERSLFHAFGEALAEKFGAQIETLPGGDTWDTDSPYQHSSPGRQRLKRLMPGLVSAQISRMKAMAKHWIRQRDAKHDLTFYDGTAGN
jgi:hypothetical protein